MGLTVARGQGVRGEAVLSDIIGQIYDCALDRKLWNPTLRLIAEFVEARTVIFNVVSPIASLQSVRSLFDYGLPEGASDAYLEKFALTDPMVRAGALYDVDEVFSAREAVGDEFWTDTRMYREWNTPFGLTEHLSGIVRKDVIRVGAISALRRDPFGEAERERLKLLLPHLRRSISIAQLMDEKTSGERQLRTVVDALAAPVLFVDDSLRLHYANRAAERLLREENLFKLGRSRLSCHSARDQKALLTAIRSGASGQSSLSLTAGDQQIVMATLLPLNQGLRREASQPTLATVALFINAPSERFEFAGEAIARQFRLTGAELQLLLALLEGDTVRKAAERFGVARSTVKTHLQRLFAKTGVTRQSDLIRKMNGLARGVVGRDANPTLIHQ